ncbi:MAG: elongation factor 1-beta [Nanoarchaeota archaeon]|nr:elongation factor 1-beta [Nanoarchaeota archaeon]MBU4300309.1 elongation factor 1-beta [Nanoarchaeota archaeon]MBU4452044.1 elongation factor 1-beta [Nanoarchaeota archaeon]MCG2723183.1 elongation factor 1-beta [archaeon]
MVRNVILTLQVMPESVEVSLESIKAEIKKMPIMGQIKDMKEEPVAFGLKSLKVLTILPDEGGITDKIEEAVRKIKGVQSAETVGVTLI